MTNSRLTAASIDVPVNYPTAVIFMDESGTKASGNGFFVIGAVKVRNPGAFQRMIKDVRDRTGFTSEFKFSEINRAGLAAYYELIDRVTESEAHFAACVVDGALYNPFGRGVEAWEGHAKVASQLLAGCINRRELVTVLMDGISTPVGCSLEDMVRKTVNRRFRATSVVGAVCLDSKSNDGLQVADLIASAIAFERRRQLKGEGNTMSPKAKVALRLRSALGLDSFADHRSARVNILTLRGDQSTLSRLGVVKDFRKPGLSSA